MGISRLVQLLTLKIKGLYTHPSELEAAPDGALSVADDIVIDRESVASPRRGVDRLTYGFSTNTYRANKLAFYQDKILAHYYDNLLAWYDSGSGWQQASGTYSPPSSTTPVRFAQANENLYFTTNSGVYKLDAYNSTPALSGAYKGLDITATLPTSATSAWLDNGDQVAYRIVWGYKDANNNLILGAPSQREVVDNDSGAQKDVLINITVPSGVTTSYFYQIYRSSATTGAEPNDELGLVYEANPTANQIAASSFTFATTDVDTSGETITETAHGLVNGDEVTFTSSGTLPAGLSTGTTYYVVNKTDDTFQVSTTYGGSAVNLTDQGSGTHTCNYGGVINVLDITPDSLRGATIYTASSQEGLANQNERPPIAEDIAVYKNHTFYANTTGKHRYYLDLLAVGGTKGIAVTDTVVIDGVTYTGAGAEDVSAAEFEVVTGGSASQNIRDTALSLVRVINNHASSTVYAYYLSGDSDLPGKMLFEERGIGGSSFAVTSDNSTCWSPSLPSSGTTESSTNDRYKNGLYFSKQSQPESVPLPNVFFVGSEEDEIKRIVPLRDSLFIFKEDGIYRLSGTDSGSFRVDLFDASTKILAPESAAVLNNQIYVFTDQGVVSVTESGVRVRSRPIEYTLLSLQGVSLSNLKNLTFAVGYESERKYILFVPSSSGDTNPTQAYVYNVFTDSWVRWTLEKTCGGVNPTDDKLYLGDSDSEYISQERKNYSYLDYVDYGFAATVSGVSTTTLTISNSDNIAAGDVIYQSSTVFSTVASVDSVAGTVVVDVDASFSTGAVTVYKAISTKIAWIPFTLGNPGIQKHFREVAFLFKQDFTGTATIAFTSDLSPSEETDSLAGTAIGLWGLFGWGEIPWGGDNIKRPMRIYVTRNKQRASQLTVEFRHATGYADYQLNGISLIANKMSERVGNRV